MTLRTRRRNGLARPVTGRTGRRRLSLTEEGVDHLRHMPRAAACRTRGIRITVLRSRPAALVASDIFLDFQQIQLLNLFYPLLPISNYLYFEL